MILFRFLKGYVCVAFTGDDLPRLIRICISRGIFLWDVKSQDPYHMQAMLYGNDVWKLHDILHKTKSKVRIQKKIGLPFSLHRYRHKAGYALGIFAMLALLFYVSGYIWMIRVSGNSFVTEEMLESYLSRKGQGIGSKKKDMDCEILEKEILADFPEVIWVSVSMKGSSLQIAMKEKMAAAEEAQTEEESGMDLLAPCDGKVTSLYVRDGTAAVEKGSDVKKGDVLIYGWIAITNDAGDQTLAYAPKNADGDVLIEGVYAFSFAEEMTYQKRIEMGQRREYLVFGTNGSYFNVVPYMLGKTQHTTLREIHPISLGGVWDLPIYCNYLTEKTYKLQKTSHSKKEMQEIMQIHLNDLQKNFEEKGIQIMDKNVIMEYSNDLCTMHGELLLQSPATEKKQTDLPEISDIKESIYE